MSSMRREGNEYLVPERILLKLLLRVHALYVPKLSKRGSGGVSYTAYVL